MSTTIQDLLEEFPQYYLRILRMQDEGKSFEEIEGHITYLIEGD